MPTPVPRSWFDGISIRVVGSREQAIPATAAATHKLHMRLREHGLRLADQTALMSTDHQDTKEMQGLRQQRGIDLSITSEGRDLGADRSARGGSTKRVAHRIRWMGVQERLSAVGRQLRRLRIRRRAGVTQQGSMAAL
eukprot:5765982-Pyramimonas_sp.AAC.1